MSNVKQLIKYIEKANYTVFFGGAGVSTESGLKDFRSKNGLYHKIYDISPEKILSHSFFIKHPDKFWDFYKKELNSLNFHPNTTHFVLTKLEQNNKLNAIITQNIDGFHQEAGSKNVIELHGSIKRNYCMNCHQFFDAQFVFKSSDIPKCNCGGIIKPDVVLYEESLKEEDLNKAIEEMKKADLLIIGGTSLTVYPAASLIEFFHGDHLVLINKEKTEKDSLADLVIHDNLSTVFKILEEELKI